MNWLVPNLNVTCPNPREVPLVVSLLKEMLEFPVGQPFANFLKIIFGWAVPNPKISLRGNHCTLISKRSGQIKWRKWHVVQLAERVAQPSVLQRNGSFVCVCFFVKKTFETIYSFVFWRMKTVLDNRVFRENPDRKARNSFFSQIKTRLQVCPRASKTQ